MLGWGPTTGKSLALDPSGQKLSEQGGRCDVTLGDSGGHKGQKMPTLLQPSQPCSRREGHGPQGSCLCGERRSGGSNRISRQVPGTGPAPPLLGRPTGVSVSPQVSRQLPAAESDSADLSGLVHHYLGSRPVETHIFLGFPPGCPSQATMPAPLQKHTSLHG